VVITDATAAELPVLQDIDVATGQMFRDIGMPEVGTFRARDHPGWGSPCRVLPDGGFQGGQREPAVV
jgi:hypothetical protein